MKIGHLTILIILSGLLSSCWWIEAAEEDPNGPNGPDPIPYRNVTDSNLPGGSVSGNTMDALPADLDNDGDLDLVLAIEFGPNKLLLNDGSGNFGDFSAGRLPAFNYNSRSIAAADFNNAAGFDLFFANSADFNTQQVNEFYLNQGSATFLDRLDLIPVSGISNAAAARDVDNDNDIDLVIGNNGQNNILINNGNARFFNETSQRFSQRLDITRDIEFGDIDGDGDQDLVIANEDDNRILINSNDTGFYLDQTSSRLPLISGIEESREAELADIDGDGDLDLYFSNVQIFESGSNPQDRLLVNNGQGVFSDVTSSQLPEIITNTADTDFLDIDGDGDLDMLSGNFNGGAQVYLNDGSGTFTLDTENWLPEDFQPRVMDFEVADYNGDGLPDIYIAVYEDTDILLLRKSEN